MAKKSSKKIKKVKAVKRKKKKSVSSRPKTSSASGKKSGLTRIKVVGVGGGGGNAVSRMMEGSRLRGVEFLAINTDAQDLNHASAHQKIYIGKALTRGLGAGMNPEVGKQAAEESRSEIMEALEGTDIVFVTAGFGGGTGTGAGPIVSEIAREKGILTIAIVTKPFSFEGSERARIAQEGLSSIRDKVDALVVIPNDRIFTLINKDTSVAKAFGFVDSILEQAVKAVAEIVNAPGIINVDFADIRSIVKDAGPSLIGIGVASGADRSMKAVENAVNSPLLETPIDGAKRVLFSIAGGRDIKMSEINDVAKTIAANLDVNAKIIFGAYYDRSLKDKAIKVTVIASGFNGMMGGGRLGRELPTLFVSEPEVKEKEEEKHMKGEKGKEKEEEPKLEKEDLRKKKPDLSRSEWDIPAFLRKKKR